MIKFTQDVNSLDVTTRQLSFTESIDGLNAELLVVDTIRFEAVSPLDGATGVDGSSGITFDWSDTSGEGVYRIVASYNSDLSTPFLDDIVEGTEYVYSTALNSTDGVYWKIFEQTVTQQTPVVSDTPTTGMTVWDLSTDPAPIYVSDTAPAKALEAANELSTYIGQSSGKTAPDVITEPSSFNFPQRCIKIGYNDTFTDEEETLIKIEAGGPISITGSDGDTFSYSTGKNVTELNFMSEAGTYNAVMTFIQDYLDVVFAWVGDLGTAVPSKTELKIDADEIRHTPSCKERNPLGFSAPGSDSPYGLGKKWLQRQRGFHTLMQGSSHGFSDYYERFHPDANSGVGDDSIFALQPDSTRSGFPANGGGNPTYAKMEVGDPNLPAFWYSINVVEGLAESNNKKVFSCAFNDSHSTGHSVDPRAKAMDYDEADANEVTISYDGGVSQNVPAITDRELLFAKRCADELDANGLTDKYALTIAYGPTRWAPKREALDSRVIVSNVANDFNDPDFIDTTTGQTHRQNFDDWLTAYPGNQIWRPNLGAGQGHIRGLWLTHLSYDSGASGIMERFKTIIPQGVIGITPDVFWEHWSTQWPMYYCAMQLMWDHTKSISDIMDKAYNTMFGNAASDIKAYYEATGRVIVDNPIHRLSIADTPKVWTDTKISEFQNHIDTALTKVTVGTDEYKRVQYVQLGFQWAKDVVRACKYWIDYNSPAIAINDINLATDANAIEDDTDSVGVWTGNVISQSVETNGSNFAFELDSENQAGLINTVRDSAIPGTVSDIYLVSVDIKHAGVGNRFAIDRVLNDGSTTTVVPIPVANTQWKLYQFAIYGGEKIRIKEVGDEGTGKIWIDNLVIEEAEEVDQAAIESEWVAHNEAAKDAIRNSEFYVLDGNTIVASPIGSSVLNSNSRIPYPGTQDTEPDPNLY